MKRLIVLLLAASLLSACSKTTIIREVNIAPNGNSETSSSTQDERFVEQVRASSEQAKRVSSTDLIAAGLGLCSVLDNNKGIAAVYRGIFDSAKGDSDSQVHLVTIFVMAVDVYCPRHQEALRIFNQSAQK
jgi:hypothetical protein